MPLYDYLHVNIDNVLYTFSPCFVSFATVSALQQGTAGIHTLVSCLVITDFNISDEHFQLTSNDADVIQSSMAKNWL